MQLLCSKKQPPTVPKQASHLNKSMCRVQPLSNQLLGHASHCPCMVTSLGTVANRQSQCQHVLCKLQHSLLPVQADSEAEMSHWHSFSQSQVATVSLQVQADSETEVSQLQQQLAEAHTAAAQAARDVAAATEASKEASAALAAAEADCAQLQQQLSEVQGQVHSKRSELALMRECMEACKGSLQQQVAGLQAELQQQRSRSEALQVQCDQAARSRERELAQVGPLTVQTPIFGHFQQAVLRYALPVLTGCAW